MKIIGGKQDGNEQERVIVLEESDRPGKLIIVDAAIQGDRGEEGIDLTIEEYGKDAPVDDHLAMGEVIPLVDKPFGAPRQEGACVKCGNTKRDDLAAYYSGGGTGYRFWCRPGHGCDRR